jgi:uracil-DNA glycosylase family 4
MEDAADKLGQLADTVSQCRRCEQLATTRQRAVPGAGHPHAHVMVVASAPTEEEEAAGLAAGSTLLEELTRLLNGSAAKERAPVYTSALVKCVPRDGTCPRAALGSECDLCYGYLSREISITTPHVLVPVGADTAAYLLGRLLGDSAPSLDPLNLRVVRTPAFSVAPVPSPSEVAMLPPHERKACLAQLESLAACIHL